MGKFSLLIVAVGMACVLLDYAEAGDMCEKVPKAFYPKLKKICDNIEAFKKCMIDKGACTKDEADVIEKIFQRLKACESMPDPKKTDDFKIWLCKLAADEELKGSLEKLASKVGALMKCTK